MRLNVGRARPRSKGSDKRFCRRNHKTLLLNRCGVCDALFYAWGWILFNTLVFIVMLLAPMLASAEALTLSIANIKQAKGTLMVAIIDSPDHWLDSKTKAPPYRQLTYSVGSTETVTLVVDDVSAGKYAVSIFHDLNGNGALDVNLLGYPKEPFGFSAPMGMFGPPDFETACVEVGSKENKMTIELN